MKIDLTPIIQAVIALLAALITWKVIPWINARTTKEQKANMRAMLRVLVCAAEQLYGANKGAEKLDYVVARLEEMGYKVDRSEIEAAVYQAFNSLPLLGAAYDVYDTNIENWTLEQLKSFCELNDIPADGCVTREDYMNAIERGGRTSDQPPDEAAESREE
ncbi:MAG: hypothetical protein IJP78_07965 [Clostridia bacterium]|nr:hypothetical protein [Clostridia bacterium]